MIAPARPRRLRAAGRRRLHPRRRSSARTASMSRSCRRSARASTASSRRVRDRRHRRDLRRRPAPRGLSVRLGPVSWRSRSQPPGRLTSGRPALRTAPGSRPASHALVVGPDARRRGRTAARATSSPRRPAATATRPSPSQLVARDPGRRPRLAVRGRITLQRRPPRHRRRRRVRRALPRRPGRSAASTTSTGAGRPHRRPDDC